MCVWQGEGWDDPGGEDWRDDVQPLCMDHPQDHRVCRPQIILLQGRLFFFESLFPKDLTTFYCEVLAMKHLEFPGQSHYIWKSCLCVTEVLQNFHMDFCGAEKTS